jgi:predicted ATPase
VAELPTGTVTFLFTDVEGSTRLLHEFGDSYSDLLSDHRRILAAITDPELLEGAIAQTIGAKGSLAEHVDQKRTLLLLDNFEHLLPAATRLSEWIGSCPNLHLLVTSRALLRLGAEREYLVEPLPEGDAVTLFTERAARPEAGPVVAELCRRLDGLPLAIELAAARTRIMSASELLERLGKVLPLLTAGSSDAPARQQTLRATIEWSYGLLAPAARTLFGRVAVFSGSFSIEAAEAVCAAELATLEALVEQSLVRRWESGRLGMLETIREFALEQLDASGEAEDLRGVHARYYLELVEEAQLNLRRSHADEWIDLLDATHPNLRAALEWAERRGKDHLKLRLTLALSDFWFARSHLAEGARRFDEALLSKEATPQQQLAILGGAALFASERGLFEQAKSLFEERLALARELSDRQRVVDSLRVLGTTCAELGEVARARELLEESVALANELPAEAALVKTLAVADLGYVLLNEEQYEGAISLYEQALRLFREHGDTRGVSVCHENIGIAELGSGRPRQAAARLRESLRIAMEIAHPPCIVNALVVLAAAEAAQRHSRPAAVMLGAEEAFRQRIGYSLQGLERRLRDQTLEIVRDDLGDERVSSAVEEGHALDTDAAAVYALSLD